MSIANINKKQKFDVYIGRPSKWGNPFIIGKDGTREQVVYKYGLWLLDQPHLLEVLHKELCGRVLGCFCYTKRCHGEILNDLSFTDKFTDRIIGLYKQHYESQLKWLEPRPVPESIPLATNGVWTFSTQNYWSPTTVSNRSSGYELNF